MLDRWHFNHIFSSTQVKPIYTLPSSNIILYILAFLYILLNSQFNSSNLGCTLLRYLFSTYLKFIWMYSNLLILDKAVYNCFLSTRWTSYILSSSSISARWYVFTITQKPWMKYSANSLVNHLLFTFTSLLMKEAPLTFSSSLKTRVWSNLTSLNYMSSKNKFHGIEYLLVFNILCCNDWSTSTYFIFHSFTIILQFNGFILLVLHRSVLFGINPYPGRIANIFIGLTLWFKVSGYSTSIEEYS